MLRKNLYLLSAVALALLLSTGARAQLDGTADQYLSDYAGDGIGAAKISGDSQYRDLVVVDDQNGGRCWVNLNSATTPYFQLDNNISLVPGEQIKFAGEGLFGIPNSSISIYLNNNIGTLLVNQTLSSNQNNAIAFGKLDNDPYSNDMVGCQMGWDMNIHRFFNNGSNTFIPQSPDFIPDGFAPDVIELADLDNLTYQTPAELIIAGRRTQEMTAYYTLWIYESDGNGSFNYNYRQRFDMGTSLEFDQIQDIAIGDLNDDDLNDIVVATHSEIHCLVNMGGYSTGYLEDNNQAPLSLNYTPSLVELTHYDYDRYPDLLVVDNNHLNIFLDTSIPSPGHFTTTPAWTGLVPPINGAHFDELTVADLTGTGALSVICTGTLFPYTGFWVFKDHSDPRAHHPVNVQVTDCGVERHPLIQWKPNEEDDLAQYRIYRALMEDETPPTENDFTLIDSVGNDVSQYIDNDVYMTQQYANFKIWYYVTAVDQAYQESLASNFVRFWGLYRPESEGPGALVSGVIMPLEFGCSASPNPFNPSTAISFKLQAASYVSLKVYDTAGRLVTELVDGWREAGTHEVTFDGSKLPSGLYFAKLAAGDYSQVQKMVLLK